MLQKLVISNYALIRHLDLTFREGFSTITGETGAGKSIILGALGLVLGNRADTQVLWDKEEKCTVEAVFRITGYPLEPLFEANDLDYDRELYLRREITPSGKSRAFINDTPVTLPVMKDIASRLVNIHSQHEILVLNSRDFQLALLDAFAGLETDVEAYQAKYRSYRSLSALLEDLKQTYAGQIAKQDYNQFLYDELKESHLEDADIEALESSRRLLEHVGEIRQQLFEVEQLFSNEPANLIASLKNTASTLRKTETGGVLASITDRITSMWIEADDLSREISLFMHHLEDDPAELVRVNERLNHLYHLLQKHRVQVVADLVVIREDLEAQLRQQIDTGEEISRVEAACSGLLEEITSDAGYLSACRCKATEPLAEHLKEILNRLGMPESAVIFKIDPLTSPGPDGVDRATLLFSANLGIEPDVVSRIASGGELSRLMLAVKSVLSVRKLIPTIIFDEIDAGISGEIAGKAGAIMQEMGESMQVIAITHLPQIAAKGAYQFLASKITENGKTLSQVKMMTIEERERAIARLLSDEEPTPESLANARRLLKLDRS
jgi:DNA repair protein RecN (Recombination protein N)